MRWWPTRRRAPSLARRMILGLVAFQAFVGLLEIFAEPIASGRLSLRQWLAAEQAAQLVAVSVDRNAAGELIFKPTPDMLAYIAAAPDFWFYVTDGTELIRGGVQQPIFERGPDGVRKDPRQGTMFQLETHVGRVNLMLGGEYGELLEGAWVWLGDRLRRWLFTLAIVAVCVTVVTIALVQLLLRPVRAAARAAAALQPGQHVPVLPEAGVPLEILPLVSATNAAFDRLEREHSRQRRFIANAAHELRTPIAILGIRLDELSEGQTKQRLRQDVRRLTMLANQLLDLERLHHSGGPQRDRSVDMVALAREVVAEVGPLAVDSGGTLAFRSALRQLNVAGDEQALRGVLLNLISNALTHGGRGVSVEVRIDVDGSIVVADGGVGVTVEARERIFEAFQRASEGSAGAGLGLYIVREVLSAHRAQIELRDGRPGAVFRIRFDDVGRWAA
jgi:signal transduction histidine kinase